MTLFYDHAMIDLSDEALLEKAEQAEEGEEISPEVAEDGGESDGGIDDALSGEAVEIATLPVRQETISDPWQEAAAELEQLWPELATRQTELFNKMGEISARYGDPTLWQRQLRGIMREAALELAGPPRGRVEQAVAAAMSAARREALAEAEEKARAKAGLAFGSPGRSQPAALTEEQKLIRAMSSARSRGIF